MKNSHHLILLFFCLFAFTSTKAITICMNDGFSNYQMTATKSGFKTYNLSGELDLGTGAPWIVTGYVYIATNTVYMDWTNSAPDGCTFYVDRLQFFTPTVIDGVMYFEYYQWCGETPYGPFYINMAFYSGPCAPELRTADPEVSKSLVALSNTNHQNFRNDLVLKGDESLEEIFHETVLQINRSGEGFVFFNELLIQAGSELSIFNHTGQHVATIPCYPSNIVLWNGKTSNGLNVPNGIYVAILRSGDETITTKFVK